MVNWAIGLPPWHPQRAHVRRSGRQAPADPRCYHPRRQAG